jgi:hypothetical protein
MIATVRFILLATALFFTKLIQAQDQPVYPKVAGYFSVVHVLVTASKAETTTNFSPAYTVGFPTGVNVLKSDKIAFSFEITPFVKVENNSSKMSNLLFHPGIVFKRKNGFAITERLAFESSGRFGVTTVFSKVLRRYKSSNSFIAFPLPIRLGNEKPITFGLGVQMGLSF